MNCKTVGTCVAAAGLFAAATCPATAEDYYRGKTMTLLVGSTAGGGYDLYARVLARFLGAHIPGQPAIVVQNMPGAGSLTSVLYLDNLAARDGTYMTIFNAGLLTEAITNPAEARVDFRKLNWVGSVTPDLRICYTGAQSGIKSWADFGGSRQVTLGATGQASVSYNDALMLKNVFHRNVRGILGYPGRSEVHLAIRRGELDGECGSIAGLPDDFLTGQLVNISFKMVSDPIEGIPAQTPYIGEFVENDEQRDILETLTAPNRIGRPFVASASIPAERLELLRDGFDKTMKDPGFLEATRITGLSVQPMSGREAQDLIASLYRIRPEIAAKAKAAVR